MDVSEDTFASDIVSLVMAHYFPNEKSDTSSSSLPIELRKRISYIVENCKLEIFFLFTREFGESSLDIKNEEYSHIMSELLNDFCVDSFDAYGFLWFCILSSCYAALAIMRNCSNSVDESTRVINDCMKDLKLKDCFTDESWKDIEVAAGKHMFVKMIENLQWNESEFSIQILESGVRNLKLLWIFQWFPIVYLIDLHLQNVHQRVFHWLYNHFLHNAHNQPMLL
ncbi:hypothetical protein HNY73_009134 [Argiope bruennichi]|uniref:Uncharacterized protein n=1 Tax=Argiope bruennichi TaxID=94029 RepID=A0A8T0F9I1_ARGBR|nr:hypothetical protein HNY73_009134 [Argiope bruennichi]